MKKIILILFLVFSYLVLNAYSISGYTNLLDSPVEDAIIELHSQQPGMNFFPVDMTISNEDGYYQFDIDSPGMYFVSAMIQAPYCQFLFYDNVFIPTNATSIHISNMNPDQENINFDFQANFPGGDNSVTGLVADISNQPIENVLIDLFPEQYSAPWLATFSTNSDENGIYNLENIPDGNYLLTAIHPNYLPYFYNGTPAWPQAEIITLENGTIEEINITLESNNIYTISGYVYDEPSGNPIFGAEIYAFSLSGSNPQGNGMGGMGIPISFSDQNGYYELFVTENEYLVMAKDIQTNSVEFYDDAATPLDATWIQLNQNVDNIDFDLNEDMGGDYSVSGTLSIDGSAGQGVPMLAVAVSSDEEWEKTVSADAINGGYVIPDLPGGEYYIYGFSPISIPTFFEDAINYEDAVLLEVVSNVNDIDIDMHIAQETGYLGCNGFVLDETGEPVANATVAFIDPFGNVQDYAYTDGNGEYNLPSLNNLNYTAFATKVFYSSDEAQLPVNGNLTWNFTLTDPNTEAGEELPQQQSNLRIFPNPFNPSTTISFDTTQTSAFATIEIYNLKGQKVKSFANLPVSQSSNHKIVWNGDDDNQRPVSTGVYLVRIRSGNYQETGKLLLLK
ncbi:MAG: carboxypeptidase regulatory-like domain-containing protein [Candidatus Cloacimonetes bacterium]|nr:carboxypeptidase regulatory-like domain-containing protein [Candidatus Cloacimonadota bacterium]MCF7812972.1 carboxypeptidase regulatory-like domain-containing protein [Candidatus Cloacimonadota bacterium]MCF7867296.1 carboxypeptidase regulatory-like domain-containing protein [Candidatus Cloacimonadota bacterium]MCF7882740.1 carboxypeptidase regulatory-like domain-containing protein [Candidatus Cloacimonadota bacterium]